jgi:uncharacterized protein (TIGR00730 family)
MQRRKMNICLFGGSGNNVDRVYIEAGEALGRAIARRGHTLVFGGGAGGLMGAAARGVREEAGKSIGIIPEMFKGDGVRFKDCTEFVYTETIGERKKLMTERSDAFVIAPGGLGTFDELFEVLTLKHLGLLVKPIAFLNTKCYFNQLEAAMVYTADCGFMSGNDLQLYRMFDQADSLLDYLEQAGQK